MAAIIPKGCTAVNTFTYPKTKAETDVLYITYAQSNKTVLEFKYDSSENPDPEKIVFNSGSVSVGLTQEETLSLKTGVQVEIQIRARMMDGSAIKSTIVRASVDRILKGGVI